MRHVTNVKCNRVVGEVEAGRLHASTQCHPWPGRRSLEEPLPIGVTPVWWTVSDLGLLCSSGSTTHRETAAPPYFGSAAVLELAGLASRFPSQPRLVGQNEDTLLGACPEAALGVAEGSLAFARFAFVEQCDLQPRR
jgi:hypothetical protein